MWHKFVPIAATHRTESVLAGLKKYYTILEQYPQLKACIKSMAIAVGPKVNTFSVFEFGFRLSVSGSVSSRSIWSNVWQYDFVLFSASRECYYGVKKGKIFSLGSANIDIAHFEERGDIYALGKINIRSVKVNKPKHSAWKTAEDISVTATEGTLAGAVEAISVQLSVDKLKSSADLNCNDANIIADKEFTNEGKITARNVNIDSDHVTNNNQIIARSKLSVTSKSFVQTDSGYIHAPTTQITSGYYDINGVIWAYHFTGNALLGINQGWILPCKPENWSDLISLSNAINAIKIAVTVVNPYAGLAMNVAQKLFTLPDRLASLANYHAYLAYTERDHFRIRHILPAAFEIKNLIMDVAEIACGLSDPLKNQRLRRILNISAKQQIAREILNLVGPSYTTNSIFSFESGLVVTNSIVQNSVFSANVAMHVARAFSYTTLISHDSDIKVNIDSTMLDIIALAGEILDSAKSLFSNNNKVKDQINSNARITLLQEETTQHEIKPIVEESYQKSEPQNELPDDSAIALQENQNELSGDSAIALQETHSDAAESCVTTNQDEQVATPAETLQLMAQQYLDEAAAEQERKVQMVIAEEKAKLEIERAEIEKATQEQSKLNTTSKPKKAKHVGGVVGRWGKKVSAKYKEVTKNVSNGLSHFESKTRHNFAAFDKKARAKLADAESKVRKEFEKGADKLGSHIKAGAKNVAKFVENGCELTPKMVEDAFNKAGKDTSNEWKRLPPDAQQAIIVAAAVAASYGACYLVLSSGGSVSFGVIGQMYGSPFVCNVITYSTAAGVQLLPGIAAIGGGAVAAIKLDEHQKSRVQPIEDAADLNSTKSQQDDTPLRQNASDQNSQSKTPPPQPPSSSNTSSYDKDQKLDKNHWSYQPNQSQETQDSTYRPGEYTWAAVEAGAKDYKQTQHNNADYAEKNRVKNQRYAAHQAEINAKNNGKKFTNKDDALARKNSKGQTNAYINDANNKAAIGGKLANGAKVLGLGSGLAEYPVDATVEFIATDGAKWAGGVLMSKENPALTAAGRGLRFFGGNPGSLLMSTITGADTANIGADFSDRDKAIKDRMAQGNLPRHEAEDQLMSEAVQREEIHRQEDSRRFENASRGKPPYIEDLRDRLKRSEAKDTISEPHAFYEHK